MGAADGQTYGKEGKKSRRGSVNNESRLKAFGKTGPTAGADWGGCNSELLQGVVMGITELGGAVTVGLSRDMGAHSLTLLLDGERETLWFNADADLNKELQAVIGKLASMS